ncbi:MAG TPA: hypothetical protein VLJ59_05510 [Mycobacteriales bacterium]|nr:hypothetical protein [Mycobacteriales bacterium]
MGLAPDLGPFFQAADWLGVPYHVVLREACATPGDPDALEGEALRLATVRSSLTDARDLLGRNLLLLKEHWHGDACSAYESYVGDVSERIDRLTELVKRVGDQLNEAASVLRQFWGEVAKHSTEALATITGALVFTSVTGGSSLVVAAFVVFALAAELSSFVDEFTPTLEQAARQVAVGRAELGSLAAGGAIGIFGDSRPGSTEWSPR